MITDWIFANVFLFIFLFFFFFFVMAYAMYYIFVKRNPVLKHLGLGNQVNNILKPTQQARRPPNVQAYQQQQQNRTHSGQRVNAPSVRSGQSVQSQQHVRSQPPKQQQSNHPAPPPPPPKKSSVPINLKDHYSIQIPNFINSGSTESIMIILKNNTNIEIEDLDIDLSDMTDHFNVQGEVKDYVLKPGTEIIKTLRIKPKYEEGVFPFKIRISTGLIFMEEKYSIKVGGTEIY